MIASIRYLNYYYYHLHYYYHYSKLYKSSLVFVFCWSTRELTWLRHYAASRKVEVSINDDVTGCFS
jgi:hypothetical protein